MVQRYIVILIAVIISLLDLYKFLRLKIKVNSCSVCVSSKVYCKNAIGKSSCRIVLGYIVEDKEYMCIPKKLFNIDLYTIGDELMLWVYPKNPNVFLINRDLVNSKALSALREFIILLFISYYLLACI